jgi:hypothetical protein
VIDAFALRCTVEEVVDVGELVFEHAPRQSTHAMSKAGIPARHVVARNPREVFDKVQAESMFSVYDDELCIG